MSRSGLTALTDHARQEAWVRSTLDELGMRLTAAPERVHVRPWATALRVPTADGTVWFKAHTAVLASEAPVTRVLARLRPELVLEVLASDDERCWLLTRDAGEKLREQIPSPTEVRLLEPVVAAYAELQRLAAPRTAELLAAGALDRRTAGVVDQLAAALAADGDGGSSGRGAPLWPAERDRLAAHLPALAQIAALAAAAVPDSVDHSDLHDGNVFVAGDQFRLGDFGDCCVGHPFVSLVVLERMLGHRLGLDPDGPQLAALRRAYLEPWSGPAPARELEEVARLVRPLGLLGRGLTWRALLEGVDGPGMAQYSDTWPSYARELTAALDRADSHLA